MKRRDFALTSLAAASAAVLPLPALAQKRKDTVVLGMTLEPTGLDPTAGAASAIAEVTQYNVFETLTHINANGTVSPMLAESWEVSPDLRTYTFKLRRGVKFQNGEPFNAQAVKFSFERAAAEKSTNKDKRTFSSMQRVSAVDDHTLVIINNEQNPDLLFLLGQATAIIVEPKSADTNNTKPVGTGPYQLDSWAKGSSITLTAWPGYRNVAAIKVKRAVFRFISDPAAQVASLLSGDVDVFQRVGVARSLNQFKNDPRFQVVIAGSRAKTILALNNKKKPLDDVRVRRAIAAAIDRKAVIDGAADGFGVPIGSHYVPGAFGYVDTTGVNPYNPDKARALLAEAGVKNLELGLILPPPPYARQGGEVIAAQLAKVGITAKLQNVEWAQWLSGVYGNKNYDMTIISHVEPFDLGNYAKPDYYWGYQSQAFNTVYNKINGTPVAADRAKLLAQAQRQLANDAANAFLFQPQWISVGAKRLRGLWTDMPIFVNDLAALSWA